MQYSVGESRRDRNTDMYTLGLTTPMTWSRPFLGTRASSYWDFYGSYAKAENTRIGKDYQTWIFGVTPTLRLRMEEGSSPWFVEAGVGVSYSDVRYRTQYKRFGSKFNFAEHVGVGISFGQERNQELVLRFQHYSNARIKLPNPGENFLQLRYAHAF